MVSWTTIDDLGIDLLQNIVSRLPALFFASADCVSHSWNHACSRVLCHPKISSACMFHPSLQVAVEGVLNKVLSEPIRPHFVIASIATSLNSHEAHYLITSKLSSRVPVIVKYSCGIIARDAISDEFKDILWDDEVEEGIMLTIGFVPGVKVKPISLLRKVEVPLTLMTDQLVTDIREFSTSISGRESPAAIMIFGVLRVDMDAVMRKMDYSMSPETVIVGDCGYDFPHTGIGGLPDAVALVFVMDRNKTPGVGETRFQALLSNGFSPIGATYKVGSVRETRETRESSTTDITVLREAPFEAIAIGRHEFLSSYFGVTKRRICSAGHEEAKWMTSLSFHELLGEEVDGEFHFVRVRGVGIRTGDTFRCYHPDSNSARSSLDSVSNLLRSFKQRSTNGNDKWEVCGGFIFNSGYRAVSLSGQPNADSSVFMENFPGVTFGGTMSLEQIGRGYLVPQESQEQKSARACLHKYSAVFFIISYAS